jgi:hypothetical protein
MRITVGSWLRHGQFLRACYWEAEPRTSAIVWRPTAASTGLVTW